MILDSVTTTAAIQYLQCNDTISFPEFWLLLTKVLDRAVSNEKLIKVNPIHYT
jgi:hypothetical protein